MLSGLAALVFAAPAHAAGITAVPRDFSPHRTHVLLQAKLTVQLRAGIRLATIVVFAHQPAFQIYL